MMRHRSVLPERPNRTQHHQRGVGGSARRNDFRVCSAQGICLLTALVLCAMTLPGCDTEPPSPPSTARNDNTHGDPSTSISTHAATPAPLPARDTSGYYVIPHPNLEQLKLDPDVGVQLKEGRAELQSHLAKPGITAEMKAAEFGTLGRLYHVYSCYAAARACYLNALELNPKATRWHYLLGHTERSLSYFQGAIQNFEKVREKLPRDLPNLIWLAETYVDCGRLDDAYPLFQSALAVDPKCAYALFGIGKVELEREQFDKARQSFEAALALAPNASTVRHKLGLTYRSLGNLDKARENLQLGGARRPKLEDPLLKSLEELRAGWVRHLSKGNEYYMAGSLDDALREFQLAVEKAPSEALPRANMASILVRKKRFADALEQYEVALQYNPDYVTAHFNLGTLLAQSGQDAQALKHYQVALAATPDSQPINFNMAQTLRRLRRFEEAIPLYQKATELYPAKDSSRLCEVFCYVAMRRWKEALECNEAHFADLKGSAAIAHNLARLLAAAPVEDLRDPRRALRIATRVKTAYVQSKRLSADHVQTYAMTLAATGQFAEAVREQTTALNYLIKNEDPQSKLAFAQENLQRYQRQEQCYTPFSDNNANIFPMPQHQAALRPHSCSTCRDTP